MASFTCKLEAVGYSIGAAEKESSQLGARLQFVAVSSPACLHELASMGLHARERGKDPCPPHHGPVIRMVSAAALVVTLVVGVLAGTATAQGTCGPLVGVPCTGGQCCRHVPQTCSPPPPPTPDPRATKGPASQHGLVVLIGVLYHYEYELPPACLLGSLAAVGVCSRSRLFFW
jgi:hypothetical protein